MILSHCRRQEVFRIFDTDGDSSSLTKLEFHILCKVRLALAYACTFMHIQELEADRLLIQEAC